MDEIPRDAKRVWKEHFHRHANAHRLSEHSHQVRRVQPRILQKGQNPSDYVDARDLANLHERTDTGSSVSLPEPEQHEPVSLLPVEHRIVFKTVVPETIELRDNYDVLADPSLSAYATKSLTDSHTSSHMISTLTHSHSKLHDTTSAAPETTSIPPLVPIILSVASIESVLTALPSTIDVPAAISSMLEGSYTANHTKTIKSTISAHSTSLPKQTACASSHCSTFPMTTSRLNMSSCGTAVMSTTLVTSTSSTFTPVSANTTKTLFSISWPATYSTGLVGGGSSYSSTCSTATSTPTAAIPGNTGDSSSFPTPTVVGSVIGGLAGLIAILLLILLLIRWWKRKGRESSAMLRSREPSASGPIMQGPTAPATAFLPGAAGALLHRLSQSRLSHSVSAAAAAAAASESTPRSFERVSGRKLPSQFSPGIEGPSMEQSARANTGIAFPSVSSAYPSGGTFSSMDGAENPFSDQRAIGSMSSAAAGTAVAGSAAVATATTRLNMEQHPEAVRPGPARRPDFHTGTSDQFIPRSSYLATPRRNTESGISRSPTPVGAAAARPGNMHGLDQGLGMGIGFARGGAATPPRGMGSRTVSYDGSVRSGRSGRANSRFYEDID